MVTNIWKDSFFFPSYEMFGKVCFAFVMSKRSSRLQSLGEYCFTELAVLKAPTKSSDILSVYEIENLALIHEAHTLLILASSSYSEK